MSIPTEMALEETRDLVSACERTGVGVQCLFINLATPRSACPLCSALYHREAEVKTQFKKGFPNIPQPLVYRQGEPRGLQRLEELGQALYR